MSLRKTLVRCKQTFRAVDKHIAKSPGKKRIIKFGCGLFEPYV